MDTVARHDCRLWGARCVTRRVHNPLATERNVPGATDKQKKGAMHENSRATVKIKGCNNNKIQETVWKFSIIISSCVYVLY